MMNIIKSMIINYSMQKRLFIWFLVVLGVLAIPLMLTLLGGRIEGNGWNWSAGDFVFAFVLLFGIIFP